MTDFSLDRLNVNDDEHLIRNWLVADGELVAVGRPIAEVETSKATVEIEARGSGPLQILKPAGANVRVGETIYAIDDGDNANVGAANHLTAGPLPTRPETHRSGCGGGKAGRSLARQAYSLGNGGYFFSLLGGPVPLFQSVPYR